MSENSIRTHAVRHELAHKAVGGGGQGGVELPAVLGGQEAAHDVLDGVRGPDLVGGGGLGGRGVVVGIRESGHLKESIDLRHSTTAYMLIKP